MMMMRSRHLLSLSTACLFVGLFCLSTAIGQIQTGEAPPKPGPLPSPAPLNIVPTAPLPPATDAGAKVDVNSIAKIPYEALIKIAQSDASQPKDAEVYTLHISSKIEGVTPSQIQLYLDRPAAPKVLKVDANGYFLVPHNEELMKENPDLVSNQPKGSLNLEVKLSLPKPELPAITDGQVSYQALFKPILLLNDSMKQVDPNFGDPDQQQFAIEITTGVEGWVRMQRKFGARTLAPDTDGSVWIAYEKLHFDEDPTIQIMPKNAPLSVRPITAAQAAAIRAR
ncbi:MAG: hypothetical protein KDN20_23995 [Verrucomicrobiae bacterium]|nr:hypothetical protein [Verrucomicrobiae bacterium]